jgi:hypothetical protein
MSDTQTENADKVIAIQANYDRLASKVGNVVIELEAERLEILKQVESLKNNGNHKTATHLQEKADTYAKLVRKLT